MSNITIENNVTIRFYVPKAAWNETAWNDKSIKQILQKRSCEHFGGFTMIEGKGGWLNNQHDIEKENITILEVLANSKDQAMTFAKVNSKFIKNYSDESLVMATVNDTKVLVK
jgi:hypothetical protein